MKSGLKEVNEFIRSAPCARGRIDPVVRQLSIPWKEAAPSTQRYYRQMGKEIIEVALEQGNPEPLQ